MTPYTIAQDDLDGMIAHARREWPREACGLVMKHPRGGRVIFPAPNVAGELHREHPTSYKPATQAFVIDPKVAAAALYWLPQGFVFDALYHSHPSGQAELSADDIALAVKTAQDQRMRAMTWILVTLPGRAAEPTLSAWGFERATMVRRKLVTT